MKSWRHPSDQNEIVPVNDNEAIEMASLQEQAVENQEDNVIEDQRLMSIICKPRREYAILTKKEVKYLRSSYKENHPLKTQSIYQYIHDFADYRSRELILDQCWNIEGELHKPLDLVAKTHVVQAWKSDSTTSMDVSLDDDALREAWEFDKDHHKITDFDAITCLSENIKEPLLFAWACQNMPEERGFFYNTAKKWNLNIIKPLKRIFGINKFMANCTSVYKWIMFVKSLFFGLLFSLLCFIDSFKDLMLAGILEHFSKRIFVCNYY